MLNKTVITVYVAMLFLGYVQSPALALTDDIIFSQLQFNLLTADTKTSAMGGTGIGFIHDPFAVVLNPAGLATITTPELGMDIQYLTYTSNQIYENLSFETEITNKDYKESVISPSFLGIAHPYKRFTFALYRQEVANYKMSYQTREEQSIAIPGYENYFIAERDAEMELQVVNYGIGLALRLFHGLSIGISPQWSILNVDGETKRSFPVRSDNYYDNGEHGFSVNVGISWKLHKRISLGILYQSGISFTGKHAFKKFIPSGMYESSPTFFTLLDMDETIFHVPAVFGIGIGIRPTDSLTLLCDVVHIRYEDLLDDFKSLYEVIDKNDYSISNSTEVHVGMEYLVSLSRRTLAFRAGGYYEPDHNIRFTNFDEEQINKLAMKILFPDSNADDQFHGTGGLGMTFNEHLQIDTTINISKTMTQISMGMRYRF